MPEAVTIDWPNFHKESQDYGDPVVLTASVVHGFKRGSKDLGFPTANLSLKELSSNPAMEGLSTGIYYGYASLRGTVYQTAISIGYNLYFQNKEKTVEAYLFAKLDDFYGEVISLHILGRLRSESSFNSLDELIKGINMDVEEAKRRLESRPFEHFAGK